MRCHSMSALLARSWAFSFISLLAALPAAAQSPSAAPAEGNSAVVVGPNAGPPAPAPQDDQRAEGEEREVEHEGFFFRLQLGIGWAFVLGSGEMAPVPGMRAMDAPKHHGPAFNGALDLGGGLVDNLALHFGLLFEKVLTHKSEPELVFTLFGIGLGLSYYFPYDIYLTFQARLMRLMVRIPETPCWLERYEGYNGPGFTLTAGKEWYGDNDSGFGLGLQGTYAYFGSEEPTIRYISFMLALTLTHF